MAASPGRAARIGRMLVALAGASRPAGAQPAAGWGIDAALTRHVGDADFLRYLELLSASGVRLVRERDVGVRRPDGTYARDVRGKFRLLQRAGFRVDALVAPVAPLRIERSGDALPEDLQAVFDYGRQLRRDFSGLVDIWEMTGEPDVGYCPDLPERTAAYQKALYLGLKGGAGPGPIVLMGALALPPGPWLERAARNGLFDYTDADNFHFYGRLEELSGLIRAHRMAADRWTGPAAALPLWLTECGIKTAAPGDLGNAARRRRQADFTVAAARSARDGGVAAYLPFTLVHAGDPYALVPAPDHPFPGWNAYAALTRSEPWPDRPMGRAAFRPDPVVLQWLPDPGAADAHKVSGTYRFHPGQAITGELRVYNFGDEAVRGRLVARAGPEIACSLAGEQALAVPARGRRVLRVAFVPAHRGYLCARWEAAFLRAGGARSPLAFGLEATPEASDFTLRPLALLTPGRGPLPALQPEYRLTGAGGPWIGINGVRIAAAGVAGARFEVTALTGDPVGDPLVPPQALAAVAGLPADGFLVVRPDRRIDRHFAFRVDLVDDRGQRFTVWENFGQSYVAPRRELWLNLHDFHPYFWGRGAGTLAFQPERIRGLQLRFYCDRVGGMSIDLALAVPRSLTPAGQSGPAPGTSSSGE